MPLLARKKLQMNNATLHKLVVAVKAHQRQERREALASGNGFVPDSGLLVCAPKTKKDMSRLIRSIQGQSASRFLRGFACCVLYTLAVRKRSGE